MPFPVTRRATYRSESQGDPAHAAEALAARLERAHASTIRQEDGLVEFDVKFFRPVAKTNLLVAIDRGTFRVHRESGGLVVEYELSFRRALLIITVMVLGVFGVLAGAGQPLSTRVETVVLAWVWLFGGNYVIACMRIPPFIRKALTIAERQQSTGAAKRLQR